jgi:hypothetical protein
MKSSVVNGTITDGKPMTERYRSNYDRWRSLVRGHSVRMHVHSLKWCATGKHNITTRVWIPRHACWGSTSQTQVI